jgi:hypothetical protein
MFVSFTWFPYYTYSSYITYYTNSLFRLLIRAPSASKRLRLAIESDDDEGQPTPPKLGKHGEQLAPCGRPSFSANPVNKKYNSRYRNAQNTNMIGGKLVDLGRAVGLVAFTLFGYDVSFEAAHNADRLRIFKSAAWYALTDAEVEEIFQHSESDVERYIKGIITAGIRLWKYEAAEEVSCIVLLFPFMLLIRLIPLRCFRISFY